MDELKTLSRDALETLREKYEYTSKIFPESDSLLAMAEVSLALGEVTKARLLVSDFTGKNGDSSRARVILAKAYLMCWDAAAAEEELKKAISLDHRNTQASELLIHIYESAGKRAKLSGWLYHLVHIWNDWKMTSRNPKNLPPSRERKASHRSGFSKRTRCLIFISPKGFMRMPWR
ncbi:MAG: hypothetical protein F4193_04720 [Candidatus Dadabacteria bacterium]|nr:hypothetical protein [Candidatus Dadabacteria bacterium]